MRPPMKVRQKTKFARRPLTRSEQMARIRAHDTGPEMILRRALHASGLRYRIQARELPGKPDIVFRRAKIAIFVHGCFWHRHQNCPAGGRTPATRLDYWLPKFERNVDRDINVHNALVNAGWKVMTLWECDARDAGKVADFVKEIRKIVNS